MINNITFENPMLGVGIFEESDGQFFKAETKKYNQCITQHSVINQRSEDSLIQYIFLIFVRNVKFMKIDRSRVKIKTVFISLLTFL